MMSAIVRQRDFRELWHAHLAGCEAIRQEILAELRAQHGADFGYTMGGRWAVGYLTQKRSTAYIAGNYSLAVSDQTIGKHTITYGGRDTEND